MDGSKQSLGIEKTLSCWCSSRLVAVRGSRNGIDVIWANLSLCHQETSFCIALLHEYGNFAFQKSKHSKVERSHVFPLSSFSFSPVDLLNDMADSDTPPANSSRLLTPLPPLRQLSEEPEQDDAASVRAIPVDSPALTRGPAEMPSCWCRLCLSSSPPCPMTLAQKQLPRLPPLKSRVLTSSLLYPPTCALRLWAVPSSAPVPITAAATRTSRTRLRRWKHALRRRLPRAARACPRPSRTACRTASRSGGTTGVGASPTTVIGDHRPVHSQVSYFSWSCGSRAVFSDVITAREGAYTHITWEPAVLLDRRTIRNMLMLSLQVIVRYPQPANRSFPALVLARSALS